MVGVRKGKRRKTVSRQWALPADGDFADFAQNECGKKTRRRAQYEIAQ